MQISTVQSVCTNDLVERKKIFQNSKKKIRLDPEKIVCDEQDIISVFQVAFEGELIHTQYCIEKKRLDAYLPKYKIGIEVDEYDHEGRNPNYEQSKQLMTESHGITVIRTNSEAPNWINRLINQIYMYIIESTKKQTEKSTKTSLINDLSEILIELEFKSNKTIKELEDKIKELKLQSTSQSA